MTQEEPRQHGVRGVYYGGDWLDMEDCVGRFDGAVDPQHHDCDACLRPCPRSRTRHTAAKHYVGSVNGQPPAEVYDIVIIGAGCLGAAVARALAQYEGLAILWLEAADDVAQGATKGNSGIVHAGYDDKPGSVRAQHCWKGNQMFAQLDRELRFGYQKNGSLVLATTEAEIQELHHLHQRGRTNGVQNLQILNQEQLRAKEPHVSLDARAALYAPDAGNVIPYEFAIALAENAVDNGVELRLRARVVAIDASQSQPQQYPFTVHVEYWEPQHYIQSQSRLQRGKQVQQVAALLAYILAILVLARLFAWDSGVVSGHVYQNVFHRDPRLMGPILLFVVIVLYAWQQHRLDKARAVSRSTPLAPLVEQAGAAVGSKAAASTSLGAAAVQHPTPVKVDDMLVGGSGSARTWGGAPVHDPVATTTGQYDTTVANGKSLFPRTERIRCSYVINCAGGASDQVAAMIGDTSFHIKPRLGDYILLNRNQGHLAKHTLFPCPDPVLGKGVLVQTTLWGNLILGPTARDTYKPEARDMSAAAVQEYILSQCKKLVPSFDAKETIHAFCGARAKSDRGDWIIEPSAKHPKFIHVAGIDSPGLAGAPSIALKVVELLKDAGLTMVPNPKFNPYRAPIITPKDGMKGLKMGPVGKYDSDGHDLKQMAANVICKCEKVTELEVVRAMRRSLPIDSSQAIRKRTRAGMGHCQGDTANFNCEARVRAIIARENGVPIEQVGGRPWPATSTLSQRWIDDEEKKELEKRMNKE